MQLNRIGRRNKWGHHDWVSRDYADVTCHATGCLFNKASKCAVPSLNIVDSSGKCSGFKCKPGPKQIEGD